MYIVFSVFDVNKNNDVMTMMVMIMTIIITVIMIIIYTIIKIKLLSENAAFRSNNRNAVFCFQRETVRCETGLIFSSLHV